MKNYPIHVYISAAFLVLILLVGSIIGGLGYNISRDILESTAAEVSVRIGRETQREFTSIIHPAEITSRLLSLNSITQEKSLAARLAYLDFLRESLDSSGELTSLFIGYNSGDFFLLRRVWNDEDRRFFDAPANTAYIVQSIEHSGAKPQGSYLFFDTRLDLLRKDSKPEYAQDYDPRTRAWYKTAQKTDGQAILPPYVFATTKKIGSTIANQAKHADAVVGVDIRLETLDKSLAMQKVTPGTHVLLVNQHGQTIGYENIEKAVTWPEGKDGPPSLARLTDLKEPVLVQIGALLKAMDGVSTQNKVLHVGNDEWRVSISPLKLQGQAALYLITAIPDRELMATAHQLIRHLFIAMAVAMLLFIPATWALARAVSQPLRKLAGETEAIRHFDFSEPIQVRSFVLEVNELALTLDSMKRTIRRFIEISTEVAAENNFDRLLASLLKETLAAANADAGILYLRDNEQLLPAARLWLNGDDLAAESTPINLAKTGPLISATLAAGTAQSVRLSAEDIAELDLAESIKLTATDYAIAVPLLNRQQSLVGFMLLLGRNKADSAHLSFIKALSASAAVSLEAKELIRDQKLLLEGLIHLIAGAIDAKSPYTGGHCARVPELTRMLATAACQENDGPYKDFHLGEEEWQAVHIASWLHDCGKVTTPEYVVDKATKLETLYDRIHEVRMRFEVLKRDAEIACLKATAAGSPAAENQSQLAATLAQLDDDYAFIASCNEGGEFMAPEKIARLTSIAARTWTRTLDDRIGISHEEKERKAREAAASLPATEQLLCDKAEHRFERGPKDRMPEDNPWGFRMPVPQLLYNKGELYNLSVARGTLSEEERYKINEHIVQTFIMLSQLPFPKHLRSVPEIAAGHHEKMDGTGYPRRLRRDEMSPVARMMAIADIFEALTAVDRPYKKGKTISEALKIMSMMKKEQHIDPDLFDLFLRSGVYQEYAERFLKPEQIDCVDMAALLGKPTSE